MPIFFRNDDVLLKSQPSTVASRLAAFGTELSHHSNSVESKSNGEVGSTVTLLISFSFVAFLITYRFRPRVRHKLRNRYLPNIPFCFLWVFLEPYYLL